MIAGQAARPLRGISIRQGDVRGASCIAGLLLAGLGARLVGKEDRAEAAIGGPSFEHNVPVGRLVGKTFGDVDGLPQGTIRYASGLALAGAVLLALLSGNDVLVSEADVATQVLLPLALASSYRTTLRYVAQPVEQGRGYLSCDLASDADRQSFEILLDVLGEDASDPELVADESQMWRLPICPYRLRPTVERLLPIAADRSGSADDPSCPDPMTSASPGPLAGRRICDLTAMWAGPLATWLLAGAGAEVHKVESVARLDGLRSLDGTGIHPEGARGPSDGNNSAMYNALNRGKERHDLDLRTPVGMAQLSLLVAESDLVIDSFSRRVMPNLGLEPSRVWNLNERICTISMPAFPAGHPWQVALGPGIHAMTGLGDLGGGRFAAPVVAYPDPLTGFVAFATTVAAFISLDRGLVPEHQEVSLLECTTRLLTVSTQSDLVGRRDPDLGRRLASELEPIGGSPWEEVSDGAGCHLYPPSPFRGSWDSSNLAPAPMLSAIDVQNA